MEFASEYGWKHNLVEQEEAEVTEWNGMASYVLLPLRPLLPPVQNPCINSFSRPELKSSR
jgi:hypothetical protein